MRIERPESPERLRRRSFAKLDGDPLILVDEVLGGIVYSSDSGRRVMTITLRNERWKNGINVELRGNAGMSISDVPLMSLGSKKIAYGCLAY